MIAVDIGAQSGRVALGDLQGEKLVVTEVHRFPNIPVRIHGTLHWDILHLYNGVLEGLRAVARNVDSRVDSVGIDTWGVDFALLDRAGRLLQNPVHYRDSRTDGAMERVFERVAARELYEYTGTQMMPFNSLFQVSAMVAADDPCLEIAETLLMIPDLLHFWLTGHQACEFTNTTTTQCLDLRAKAWAFGVLERVGVPGRLFPEIVTTGTILGPMRQEVAEDVGLTGLVITPASHDTASAIAAIPFQNTTSFFISSGTWSLVGVETNSPEIHDRTFAANLTNGGGVGGTFHLIRNVTGLWLLNECRRIWALDGGRWELSELIGFAESAPALRSLIDPNDPVFVSPGDIPARIRAYCERTGQERPRETGAVIRCVLESLVVKYRQTIELLQKATGIEASVVHIVGGGARISTLCQWTADATGLPVLAGPVEATQIGNLLVQATALGEIGTLADARAVVVSSFSPVVFEPGDRGPWDEAFGRLQRSTSAAAVEVAVRTDRRTA